ncbi:MAG TPA: ComEC/Rec2 family competence protein, partial [Anaerolineae bacterium]
MFLIPLTVAFLLGIAIASRFDLPLFAWAWLLLLPIAYFLVWRRDAQIRAFVILLFAFMLGALRFAFADQPPGENALAHYNDHGRAVLTGQVVGPPDVRDRYANLRLSVSRIEINRVVSDTQGLALVQAPRAATARYGDSVRIEGTLTTPGESADFSYRDYLAREDIRSLVWATRVTVLASGQGDPFFASLYAFRERAHTTINAILPEPHAALLSGILLGDDNGMPSDLTDDFNATNTSHIIAISGFNVAIIAGLLARLAALIFPKRGVPGALLVILGLVTYTLFVGASASVVRAALMGSLTILAVQFNRQSLALNSLGASALFMLALNPLTLWDLGFQLSALATLGIILFADPLIAGFRKVMGRLTKNGWGQHVFRFLGDNLIVTLAAQITTTIIIAYTFHRLSLIGLLTNLLVLPVQPQVMIWGGLATLGGML